MLCDSQEAITMPGSAPATTTARRSNFMSEPKLLMGHEDSWCMDRKRNITGVAPATRSTQLGLCWCDPVYIAEPVWGASVQSTVVVQPVAIKWFGRCNPIFYQALLVSGNWSHGMRGVVKKHPATTPNKNAPLAQCAEPR